MTLRECSVCEWSVLVEVGVSLLSCGCGEWKGGEGRGREEDLVTDVFV